MTATVLYHRRQRHFQLFYQPLTYFSLENLVQRFFILSETRHNPMMTLLYLSTSPLELTSRRKKVNYYHHYHPALHVLYIQIAYSMNVPPVVRLFSFLLINLL